MQRICSMEPDEHLQFTTECFAAYCSKMNVVVPQDFLEYVVKAMKQLKMANRTNILYALAKSLGTQHSDGKDSVFPSKQLLTGMIEHCVNLFSAKCVHKVRSCCSIWSSFMSFWYQSTIDTAFVVHM